MTPAQKISAIGVYSTTILVGLSAGLLPALGAFIAGGLGAAFVYRVITRENLWPKDGD